MHPSGTPLELRTAAARHPVARAAAVAFILFFIGIIVIADRGEGDRWWSFLTRIPNGDKIGHLGLVGVLSFLCNLAFAPRPPRWLPAFVTATTFLLLCLLTLEELAQAFLPHRTCDFGDWVADLIGLAAGQTAARWLRQRIA